MSLNFEGKKEKNKQNKTFISNTKTPIKIEQILNKNINEENKNNTVDNGFEINISTINDGAELNTLEEEKKEDEKEEEKINLIK